MEDSLESLEETSLSRVSYVLILAIGFHNDLSGYKMEFQ